MNPYDAGPETLTADSLAPETDHSASGGQNLKCVLLVVWLLEGAIKAVLLMLYLRSGGTPFIDLQQQYLQTETAWFFLGFGFFFFESFGPWVGVYHLLTRWSNHEPLDVVIGRILKVALPLTFVITVVVMLCCQWESN